MGFLEELYITTDNLKLNFPLKDFTSKFYRTPRVKTQKSILT